MSRIYKSVSDEVDPRHRSSKDRKRWCRGKIGVEHKTAWVDDVRNGNGRLFPWRQTLICSECKKEMDWRDRTWTFGEVMTKLREKAGLTQLQLAEKLEVSQPSVARMERGDDLPTTTTIQRFAKALGLHAEVRIAEATIILNGKRWGR